MKKFKKIYVEITNICNLRCNFCPDTRRKLEFMTVKNFKKIATEVKKHCDYIYLHVKGEPLLHPDLQEIFNICEQLKLKICLTTNGTLIGQNFNLLQSTKSLHKLHISLHSLEANNAEISQNEYLENIVKLVNTSKFITVLRLWNDGGMDTQNQTLCNLIKNKLNLDFDILKNLDNNVKIKDKCYIEFGEKFDWPNINNHQINDTGFCYGLRNQLAILVDGTTTACCLDNDGEIKLGNIFESNIEEIISSEFSTKFLQDFSNRKLPHKLCKTCGFISRFSV